MPRREFGAHKGCAQGGQFRLTPGMFHHETGKVIIDVTEILRFFNGCYYIHLATPYRQSMSLSF